MAAHLGHPYPEEMLTAMTATTFRRWQEYDRRSPLGGERWDALVAMALAALVNLWRTKGRPARASDYMPRWGQAEPQSARTMQSVMARWAKQVNRFFDERH